MGVVVLMREGLGSFKPFGRRSEGPRSAASSTTARVTAPRSTRFADIGLTYHLTEGVDASVRVTNLFDEAYVQWAQVSYPNQVLLGQPRGVTFGVAAKF